MKKILNFLAATGLVTTSGSVAFACNKNNSVNKVEEKPNNDSNQNNDPLNFGKNFKDQKIRFREKIELSLNFSKPKKGAYWYAKSQDNSVVQIQNDSSVDYNGTGKLAMTLIGGETEGETTIEVTYGSFTKSFKVTSYKGSTPYFDMIEDFEAVVDTQINKNTKGKKVFLNNPKLKENGENPDKQFRVKSSDETIVRVNFEKAQIYKDEKQEGLINFIGLKKGEAIITVTYEDNISTSFKVIVSEKFDLNNLENWRLEIDPNLNNLEGFKAALIDYLKDFGLTKANFNDELRLADFKKVEYIFKGSVWIYTNKKDNGKFLYDVHMYFYLKN
ncbi:hypothetical protein SHELI_v1c09860 [Spiroplasma helicoides]|uniref:BIG2 domain-containing protein n=1 Tax=Spiroplasma helicoides TaxID=216938 RepID=A0A1B3SLY4_9MOLU|nr:lipoprotein [Spiroplasma helicoides]AOG60933.1 hypothetical protein SHELI_v1c09860 [Spiroplasma helicoides]